MHIILTLCFGGLNIHWGDMPDRRPDAEPGFCHPRRVSGHSLHVHFSGGR